MLARLAETIAQLKKHPPPIPDADLAENLAFLGWLADNHFTFLGCRDYVFRDEGEGKLEARYESGLGVLADPETRVIRRGRRPLEPDARAARVSHPAGADHHHQVEHALQSSIGARIWTISASRISTRSGKLVGERRFVGLFTSVAYGQLPAEIPLLRRKVAQVLAGSGLPRRGHDGKALAHVLEHVPARRVVPDLGGRAAADRAQHPQSRRAAEGARLPSLRQVRPLRLRARVPAARALQRRGARTHPRDSSRSAFDGRTSAAMPMLDDEWLARIHYIVGRNPGPRPDVDVKALEVRHPRRDPHLGRRFRRSAAPRSWRTAERACAAATRTRFPATIAKSIAPSDAVDDIGRIEAVLKGEGGGGHIARACLWAARATADERAAAEAVRARELRAALRLPAGVRKSRAQGDRRADLCAQSADRRRQAGLRLAAQFPDGRAPTASPPTSCASKPLLEDAFHAVWRGEAESDGFNRLTIAAGLAVARHHDPARDRQVPAPGRHRSQPDLCRSGVRQERRRFPRVLVELFRTLHDPGAVPRCRLARGRRRAHSREPRVGACRSAVGRRRPHHPRGDGGDRRDAAGELLPADATTAAPSRSSPSSWTAASSTCFRRRNRCTRSSSIRRRSKACICASAGSRAAASAGRTGRRISAPRS